MNKATQLLVSGLCVAAALLAGVAFATTTWRVNAASLLGLATFTFLAIFSEVLATSFVVGPHRKVTSSVAFIPIFASALVFPPESIIGIAALTTLAIVPLRRAPTPWFAAFNVAQFALSYGIAAFVYSAMGGAPGLPLRVSFVAFLGMAATFFLLNVAFVSSFLAIKQSSNWWQVVLTTIAPGGGNLLYDLLASPIAVFAAVVYGEFSAAALILVALPLFLVRHSYSAKLQLERVNKDLLTVLVKAIETRDPYTSGHSIRVASLARAIGKELRLRRRALAELEMAALLHDIGKVEALYSSVIRKADVLDEAELELIRTHAKKGAEILLGLSAFSENIITAVRHHHERFDGGGYPDGLRGERIPFAARVIMVCDAVDAMFSDRPYRSALARPAVESELRRCSGSQFDPRIVEATLRNGILSKVEEGIPHQSTFLQVVAAD